ncbi:unnamed protein product [Ectocarpus sp. 13 AM-2016]
MPPQVNEDTYQALKDCIFSGDFATCEAVPAGEPTGYLVNPVGGMALDMAGPANSSMTTPPVPTLESPEWAAQLAECYWMALSRDVPFSRNGTDEITIAAAACLDFCGGTGVAVAGDGDGCVDPSTKLFRASFVGADTGPMIFQLLVKVFTIDSSTVTPKQATFKPGVDYMTGHDDWLFIQNGGAADSHEEMDGGKRYIRNGRDLSRLVHSDNIYSEFFRGALILLDEGVALSKAGSNGPYADTGGRQPGFVEYGTSHAMNVRSCEAAQRSAWYQKWNVHLMARPEALIGTLHHVLVGDLQGPTLHDAGSRGECFLIFRRRVVSLTVIRTLDLLGVRQATKGGSPAHTSYPAGHAVQNGAFATVLKALVGLERGGECFTDPVLPDDDGLELVAWEGGSLTYEGEINKLAANVAFGRQMTGVHYSFDSTQGLLLGEAVAVRMLQQELMSYPEAFPCEFRLFDEEVLKLHPDGSISVDGNSCNGDLFTGARRCL